MKPKVTRRLLFVVGMHRSGTSALCAALNACGATFGEQLLDTMEGVNEEGFWEDSMFVDINEQLLGQLNTDWYTVRAEVLENIDWSSSSFSEIRSKALALLGRGFGNGPLEAVKDPRVCITLPFWLSLCEELSIEADVWVINRAPMEVARSLERRDGFPLSYGLRLYSSYRKLIAASTPLNTRYLTYDALLANPGPVLRSIADELPISIAEEELRHSVRQDLKHQHSDRPINLLDCADTGDIDLARLDEEINVHSPARELSLDMVKALVARGQILSEKGVEFEHSLSELSQQHIEALSTVDARDRQIEVFDTRLKEAGQHLSEALATIPERDEQISAMDTRLEKIGAEHSYALKVINERDDQLQKMESNLDRIFAMPVIGRVFSKLWFNEKS